MSAPTSASDIYSAVHTHYSAASSSRTASGTYESNVARAFGYTTAELASIPESANLGLSCGNPLVLAALKSGETVVDLGSGAGFDVFLAAPRVGPTGQVIGVDVNRDMLAAAARNLAAAREKGQAGNVRFVEAPITDIKPVESGSVDCVISNCVVNLVPEMEKPLVFREMWRVLKPGGRVAISDILIRDGCELPENLKRDMGLYVGCVAGASLVSGYEKYLREAGFRDVLIVDGKKDLNVYNTDVKDDAGSEGKEYSGTSVPVAKPAEKSCCGTTVQKSDSGCGVKEVNGMAPKSVGVDLKHVDFNKYAGSYNIYAVKA